MDVNDHALTASARLLHVTSPANSDSNLAASCKTMHLILLQITLLYSELGLEEGKEVGVRLLVRLGVLVAREVTTGRSPTVHVVVEPLDGVLAGVLLLELLVHSVDRLLVLVLGGKEADGDVDLVGVLDVNEAWVSANEVGWG